MHARPCGALVQYIVTNNLNVTLRYQNKEVLADSVLDLLSLCIPKGAEVSVDIASDRENCTGNESASIEAAAQDIKTLFANQFNL